MLGRVIEKVTGKSYVAYVTRDLLAPLGIKSVELGRSLPRDRNAREPNYVDPNRSRNLVRPDGRGPVALPDGGFYLEAMDSHGGLIASAPDLVRFASAFNEPRRCKILKPRSIALMFARPPGAAGKTKNGKPRDAYYACGWEVRPIGDAGVANTWHGGSLDGTSTLLVRRHDGLTWAVLFNSRDGAGKDEPAGAIDALVHEAADAVKNWPR